MNCKVCGTELERWPNSSDDSLIRIPESGQLVEQLVCPEDTEYSGHSYVPSIFVDVATGLEVSNTTV